MTRLVRFANNATSSLASNLSAVGLTITLTPGDGAKFPALTAGQFFKGTLVKADGTKEVVKVTSRSTDTLTIVRADESVAGVQTAYAFLAGDKFELRLTAEALSAELDRLDAAAFLDVVSKSANYTVLEADVSKLIKTSTAAGNITHTLPEISTLVGSFEVQISKDTGDANTVTINRAGADTINGLTSYSLSSQYQCVWLVADLVSNTWTAITSASATNKVADEFVGAGSAGPFTLSGDPGSKNNTDVYVGGVYQQKSTYTLVGTQLTLGGAVSVGVSIECMWAQPMAIGTPSDGTVSTAKLAAGAVTFAKTTGIAPMATRIDVASVAGTVNLTTGAPSTDDIQITGALAITAFTVAVGRVLRVRAGGAFTLTNNANIVTQTGANIIAAAGDTFMLRATAANTVEVLGYTKVLSSSAQIQPISASVAANALTISVGALALDFRSVTLGSGTVTTVTGTPANLVISSGSTLGTVSAQQSRIAVIALNNAGTIELAAVNISGGNDLSETGLISTTAEGGAGAADSANVIYSTTARTSVAYRVIGYIESTQATAGTWATAPSTIQGQGGQALAAMSSLGYGQTWQTFTVGAQRVYGTTYYNTTGKPISVSFSTSNSSSTTGAAIVNGTTIQTYNFGAINAITFLSFTVPPGASYSITQTAGSATSPVWAELR